MVWVAGVVVDSSPMILPVLVLRSKRGRLLDETSRRIRRCREQLASDVFSAVEEHVAVTDAHDVRRTGPRGHPVA